MRVLHMIGGGDIGGAKTHVISLAARLSESCTVKLVSFREGDFARDAKAAGIDTVVIPYGSRDFQRLLRVVREFRPDVIHCHGGRANVMGVRLKKRTGIPVLTTVHSDYRLDYLGRPLKQYSYGVVNSLALRKIDYYNCVSSHTREMLIRRGFPAEQMYTILNGIDYQPPRAKADRGEYLTRFGGKYEKDDVIIGIAARLTAVKDVPMLLRALAKALQEDPRLKLLIAGEGEEEAHLKALTKELGLTERVIFAGWIRDIREFFSAVDINVISSLSEAFPYSVLEGVQEGCALISTDVGGLRDFIDDGENGILVPPQDDAAMAKALCRYSLDAALRQQHAEKLLEKAKIRFSLDYMAKTQMETYESILRRERLRQQKRCGVVICGAYGKGNAGDDAILQSIVTSFRTADPELPLTVMSRDPVQTELEYPVRAIQTFHLGKTIRAFRHAKLYVNGGGSLIQDVTSSRSLYFFLWTLWLAHRLGCRVMMYGCGIGPVQLPGNRKLAARVLSKCVDVITLRESDSLEELHSMGVQGPEIVLAADTALNLPAASDAAVDAAMERCGIPPKGRYLCLCVRKWENFEKAAPILAAAADYAAETCGLTALFLPMEPPGDSEAGELVRRQMRHPSCAIDRRLPPEITKGILSRAEMLLSMRLHALIFAAGQGVPMAGVVYDQKVSGFLRYLEQPRYQTLEALDAETLCGFVDEMHAVGPDALRESVTRLQALERRNLQCAMQLLEQ